MIEALLLTVELPRSPRSDWADTQETIVEARYFLRLYFVESLAKGPKRAGALQRNNRIIAQSGYEIENSRSFGAGV